MEALIKRMRLVNGKETGAAPGSYGEAVATSSPTLPLGTLIIGVKKGANPSGLWRIGNSIPRVAAAATLG